MRVILEIIKRVSRQWTALDSSLEGSSKEIAIFLAGDFNSLPEQEAYLEMEHSNLMTDFREHVPLGKRYGDETTFTGFHKDQDPEDQGRIDFIWLGPKDMVESQNSDSRPDLAPVPEKKCLRWIVHRYAVLPNVFEDGMYNSDHRAVVGDVSLHLSL